VHYDYGNWDLFDLRTHKLIRHGKIKCDEETELSFAGYSPTKVAFFD